MIWQLTGKVFYTDIKKLWSIQFSKWDDKDHCYKAADVLEKFLTGKYSANSLKNLVQLQLLWLWTTYQFKVLPNLLPSAEQLEQAAYIGGLTKLKPLKSLTVLTKISVTTTIQKHVENHILLEVGIEKLFTNSKQVCPNMSKVNRGG